MLLLSDFTIKFKPSQDYLRTVILLYAFTLIVLMHSGLPWIVTMSSYGLLCIPLPEIIRHKSPIMNVLQLSAQGRLWRLNLKEGPEILYEKAEVYFDGGLFFLLRLKRVATDLHSPSSSAKNQIFRGLLLRLNKRSHRTLVVFKDQLTKNQYRVLNYISFMG